MAVSTADKTAGWMAAKKADSTAALSVAGRAAVWAVSKETQLADWRVEKTAG
jgi:hypothetical protein